MHQLFPSMSKIPSTMRAVVIYETGGPEVLKLETRPVPQAENGKVLIEIKARGLNRSEMFTRWGHSKKVVQFPRIMGIECVGVVAACPSGRFREGQQVAAIMGGLGRQFDGGYAEYTLVPESIVIPFESDLPWETLGAVPEMFQTANGALEQGLELQPGETLLIRGGTSSVGMTAAQLAKVMGARVFATTRNPAKADKLKANGADEVILDDGEIAAEVRALVPEGVDKVLELVGPSVMRDSLLCVRPKGICCQVGYLGNQWAFEKFAPLGEIPSTVRLTAYGGDASDLPPERLQAFLDHLAAGRIQLNVDRIFKLDEMLEAHAWMENNKASGKLVVVN